MKLLNYLSMSFVACSLFLSARAAEIELPTDPIPSLNEQQQRYVALYVPVYESLNGQVHPLKTPIPGLASMVRMQYSYVHGLIKDHPESFDFLKQFWQKASSLIQPDQLTIETFSKMTQQLANLLSHRQGNNDYTTHATDWKDIDTYWSNYGAYPSLYIGGAKDGTFVLQDPNKEIVMGPMYGLAVLCHPKGGFAFKRFNTSYLDYDFPLSLVALPLNNPGPHGGNVFASANYTSHEFTHVSDFAASFVNHASHIQEYCPELLQKCPSLSTSEGVWEMEKSMFRRIRESSDSFRNQAATFWLLHETLYDVFNLKNAWAGEEPGVPDSKQRIFWGMISSVATHTTTNLVDPISQWYLGFQPFYQVSAVHKVINRFHVSGTTFLDDLVTVSVDLFDKESQKIGAFSFTQPYMYITDTYELMPASSVSPIQWEEGGAGVSADLQQHCQEVVQSLTHVEQEKLFNGNPYYYRQNFKDEMDILRKVYGADTFPKDEEPLERLVDAVVRGMDKFWQEFYQDNKHLFSTTSFDDADSDASRS